MREIEIKLRVRDLGTLEEKLRQQGCALSAPMRQHDVIYSYHGTTAPWEGAKEGNVIVRIRRQDGHHQFNLKQQRSSEMDNIEYETDVSNPDAVDKILQLLGYAPMVEVKKERRKGTLDAYSVCLDAVEQLGNFFEIEKMTEDHADPEVVRGELFSIAESFGLARTDEETRGYDTQIAHLKHVKQ